VLIVKAGSGRTGAEEEIELDRYREDFDGLLIAEVEFPDEETADLFEPPESFDEEVTGNRGTSTRRWP
jgi:CYTH domain-containing protein